MVSVGSITTMIFILSTTTKNENMIPLMYHSHREGVFFAAFSQFYLCSFMLVRIFVIFVLFKNRFWNWLCTWIFLLMEHSCSTCKTSMYCMKGRVILRKWHWRTRRALLLYRVYGDSTLLVLNWTSLNSVNS